MALALLVALPATSRAEEYNYNTWSQGKPLTPSAFKTFQKPLNLFSEGKPSLRTGAYTESISFPLPAARNGHKPQLRFDYSSQAGWTPYGFGWSLSLDSIRRTLRKGIPSYLGPGVPVPQVEDQFHYSIGGRTGLLLRASSGPLAKGVLYRPQDDNVFARFYFRSADSSWLVEGTDGRTWILGGHGACEQDTATFQLGTTRVYTWYVASDTDSLGNVIRYAYVRQGVTLLSSVEYDHRTTGSLQPVFVWLDWQTNPNPTVLSYEKGYAAQIDQANLVSVTVREEPNGSYPPTPTVYHYHQLLYSTSGQGNDNKWRRFVGFQPHQRPAVSLQYNRAPERFDPGTSVVSDPDPSSHEWALNAVGRTISDRFYDLPGFPYPNQAQTTRVVSRLVDFDGDGDLDLLWSSCAINTRKQNPSLVDAYETCGWKLRVNQGGQWGQNIVNVPLPVECGDYLADCQSASLEVTWRTDERPLSRIPGNYWGAKLRTVQTLQDVDADGLPDLVYVKQDTNSIYGSGTYGTIMVCKNTGNNSFSPCTPYWTIPYPDQIYLQLQYQAVAVTCPGCGVVAITWTDALFTDLDGDGTPDFVMVDTNSPNQIRAHLLKEGGAYHRTVTSGAPPCSELPIVDIGTTCLGSTISDTYWAQAIDPTDFLAETCTLRQLSDLNGDGVKDLLWIAPATPDESTSSPAVSGRHYCRSRTSGGLIARFGQGGSFDAENEKQYDIDNLTLDFRRTYYRIAVSDPTHVTRTHAEEQLVDVNGDGRLDLLRTSQATGQIEARIFQQSQFGPWVSYGIVQAPRDGCWIWGFQLQNLSFGRQLHFEEGYANADANQKFTDSKTAILDFDGDGVADFITGPGNADVNDTAQDWTISALTGDDYRANAFRMKQSRYDGGQQRDVSYARPPEQERNPAVNWVVGTLTETDDVTSRNLTTSYSFKEPLLDAGNAQFAGFRQANASTPEGTTESYFHLDYDRRGRIEKSLVYDTGLVLRKKTETSWMVKALPALPTGHVRYWVRPDHSTTSINDGPEGQTRRITKATFSYVDDPERISLGLVASIVRGFDSQSHIQDPDARTETFDYWVVPSTPGTEAERAYKKSVTRAGANGTVAQELFFYDTQCPGNNDNAPNMGLLCSKRVLQAGDFAEHSYGYDSLGRLTSYTDPDEAVTTFTYHGQTAFKATESTPTGETTYFGQYNGFSGKPGRICGPQYVSNPATDKCEEYVVDDYGRVMEEWKPLREYLGVYYSAKVASYSYQDQSVPGGPPYVEATYFPDPFQLTGTSSSPRKRRVYYDGYGNVLQAINGDVVYQKDAYAYDRFGRLEKAWQAWDATSNGYEPASGNPSFTYQYDSLSRQTRVTNPDGTFRSTEYRGNVIVDRDELSNEKIATFDAHGGVTSIARVTGTGSLARKFEYDGAGRIVKALSETDALYRYTRDGEGRVTQVVLPDTSSWTFAYKPSGRPATRRLPNGGVTTFNYINGRLVQRDVSSASSNCSISRTSSEIFIYGDSSTPKELGRLQRVQSTDFTKTFEYDPLGRASRRRLEDLGSGQTLWFSYVHNSGGDLAVKTTEPNGDTLRYEYDSSGRLREVSSDDNRFSSSISYYADGRPQVLQGRITGHNTLSFLRVFAYDAKRRLEGIETTINGGSPWSLGYTYYDDNQVQSLSDSQRGISYLYHYDGAQRLTRAEGYGDRERGWPDVYEYTYHANGALNTVTQDGRNTLGYRYPGSAKYLASDIELNGSRVTRFLSDPGGARCRKTEAQSTVRYWWLGSGRLGRVSNETSGTEDYFYDESNERWKSTRGSASTLFFAGAELDTDTSAKREYVTLPFVRCLLPAATHPGKCYFSDQLSVAVSMAEDATTSWSTTYTPYGADLTLVGSATSAENRFGFHSNRRALLGELSYYGARYYDPSTRVFLSVDPLRLAGATDAFTANPLNPFVYAAADPISKGDADGKFVCELFNWAPRPGTTPSDAVMAASKAAYMGCLCYTGRALLQTGLQKVLGWLGGSSTRAAIASASAGTTLQMSISPGGGGVPPSPSASVGKQRLLPALTETSRSAFLTSADREIARGGVTAVGRAIQSHGGRPRTFFKAGRNAAENARLGHNFVSSLLADPAATVKAFVHKVHGPVVNVRLQNGVGAQFLQSGMFIGLLERFTH